ncbi:MAG: thermonuclease family protein [Acetobacteraceae bacterium]
MRNILICILCIFLAAPAYAGRLNGRVVGVHDGDTATVISRNEQIKCRLGNIDAPELHQPFGSRSRQALSRMIYRKPVTIDDQGEDRYGRRICIIYTNQGEVNRRMVKEGMAWVYVKYNRDPSLQTVEAEARIAHRGLWRERNPIPPWEWRHGSP